MRGCKKGIGEWNRLASMSQEGPITTGKKRMGKTELNSQIRNYLADLFMAAKGRQTMQVHGCSNCAPSFFFSFALAL